MPKFEEPTPEPEAEPVVEPDATPTPEPEAPEAEVQEADAEVDLDSELEGNVFDRAAMQRVRDEAAKRRVELKPYKDAFDGYNDEAKDKMLEITQRLVSDPVGAAKEMRDIIDRIEVSNGVKPEGEAETEEAPVPLDLNDPEQLEQYLQTREQGQQAKADADSALVEVHTLAAELGYEIDPTKDALGRWPQLIHVAQTHPDVADAKTDVEAITKAHEILTGEVAALGDQAVEDFVGEMPKREDWAPIVHTRGAPAVEKIAPPKNLKEARARMEQRLDAIYDEGPAV